MHGLLAANLCHCTHITDEGIDRGLPGVTQHVRAELQLELESTRLATQLSCYASLCPRLCGSLWLSRPDPSPLVSILFQCDFILPALPPPPGLSQATSFALGTPDLGHSLPSDVVFLCPPGLTPCHQIREVLPACGPLSNSCWLYTACGSGITWAFVYMAVCPPSWSGGPTRVWPWPV